LTAVDIVARKIVRWDAREFELDNRWRTILLVFYLYRCFSSVVAQLLIVRLTSIGDTSTYQRGEIGASYSKFGATEFLLKTADFGDFQVSTYVTAIIGRFLNTIFLGNAVLINIGFQTIAFLGIVYLLMSVTASQRLRLVVLLAFPSFTLWTSMASKECIVVFAVGVLGGGLVRLYYNRYSFDTLQLLAIILLWMYKPHYVPSLVYLLIVTVLGSQVRQKALIALLIGFFSLAALYVFRDFVDALSLNVQRGFTTFIDQGSTRTELFFVDTYDVFARMPLGFLMALVGPTIEETLSSPLHLFAFVESTFLLLMLFFYVFSRLPRLPIYSVIAGSFFAFWILFPNYPFGVMNPGSAIRYRAGWIVLFIIATAVLQSRNLYGSWLSTSRRSRL